MSSRQYRQNARAAAAEQTRSRVLEALYQRLREAPAEAVSIDDVARRAGVARSTVYLIFESRAGLFDAFARYLYDRGGFQRIVEATKLPDARSHLREAFRVGPEVMAAEREVGRALFSMAALDPDTFAGAVQRAEQSRAGGMEYLAQRLHDEGLLRPDVELEEAVDILWVLTSFETTDLLLTGRGLTPAQIAERLITIAERTLCVPDPHGAPD